MLVNVSEMRDYIMGLRMLSDISWNAKTVLSQKEPGEKYTAWWAKEYFGGGAAADGDMARKSYDSYFDLINTANKLWLGSDCIEALLSRLYNKIETGNFREDLYHRLSVILINVPSLNERIDDIPLLAKHFVELSTRELKCAPPRLTRAALERLQNYDWPGNVRELRNVIERAMIIAKERCQA